MTDLRFPFWCSDLTTVIYAYLIPYMCCTLEIVWLFNFAQSIGYSILS